MTRQVDVLILGAGASGLMCAVEAGKRGRSVAVLDHAKKAGQKIVMSGGGFCNFTHLEADADQYISHTPHFVTSALSRYTPLDFLELVRKHRIGVVEKAGGQLFCRESAAQILHMLLSECEKAQTSIRLGTFIGKIAQSDAHGFRIETDEDDFECRSLVVATGGLSVPEAGASPLGYEIAKQFHIPVWPPSPGLVPFTLQPKDKIPLSALSGLSVKASVRCKERLFCDSLLFTHRGLSGPVILQTSLYWKPGDEITIDLLPEMDLVRMLKEHKRQHPQKRLKSILAGHLPRRLIEARIHPDISGSPLQILSYDQFEYISQEMKEWRLKPGGTEGWRTAEVTVGGVDCGAVSSKTMESSVQGLYFIGEVLDVAGWLGGFNLQWAWSSGWCAGQYV